MALGKFAAVLNFNAVQPTGRLSLYDLPYVPGDYKFATDPTTESVNFPTIQFMASTLVHKSYECYEDDEGFMAYGEDRPREIWRGHVSSTLDHPSDSPLTQLGLVHDEVVICKIARGNLKPYVDGLVREANNYTTVLQNLQGMLVPKFYGIFYGWYPKGSDGAEDVAACILLEDVGNQIKVGNGDRPLSLAQK